MVPAPVGFTAFSVLATVLVCRSRLCATARTHVQVQLTRDAHIWDFRKTADEAGTSRGKGDL
jgi:hypothetical protein